MPCIVIDIRRDPDV